MRKLFLAAFLGALPAFAAAVDGLRGTQPAGDPPALRGNVSEDGPLAFRCCTQGLPWVNDGRPPEVLDLSIQFADGSRNQRNTGSCHAFAAVALLEAAVYRRERRRARFSEADLFFQRQAFRDDGKSWMPSFFPTDANDTAGDLELALNQGIASGGDYERFQRDWLRYQAAWRDAMSALPFVPAMIAGGSLVGLLTEPWRYVSGARGSEAIIPPLRGYATALRKGLHAQREGNKAFLRGLGSRKRNVNEMTGYFYDPVECADYGKYRGQLIVGELDALRPVGVGMNISGLAEWNQGGSTLDDKHGFVVSGYTRMPDGSLLLHTRNSWGTWHSPSIPERQFCRILQVLTVWIKDREAPPAF